MKKTRIALIVTILIMAASAIIAISIGNLKVPIEYSAYTEYSELESYAKVEVTALISLYERTEENENGRDVVKEYILSYQDTAGNTGLLSLSAKNCYTPEIQALERYAKAILDGRADEETAPEPVIIYGKVTDTPVLLSDLDYYDLPHYNFTYSSSNYLSGDLIPHEKQMPHPLQLCLLGLATVAFFAVIALGIRYRTQKNKEIEKVLEFRKKAETEALQSHQNSETACQESQEEPEFDFRKSENKRTIYIGGTHVSGSEYKEVVVSQFNGTLYYSVIIVYDKMNGGGYSERVPQEFIVDGTLDKDGLVEYLISHHKV